MEEKVTLITINKYCYPYFAFGNQFRFKCYIFLEFVEKSWAICNYKRLLVPRKYACAKHVQLLPN